MIWGYWTPVLQGFFYNRYEAPNTGDAGTETDLNLNQQLAYHVVGTPQSEDITVLAIPENPEWMMGTEITHDGRWEQDWGLGRVCLLQALPAAGGAGFSTALAREKCFGAR